LFYGGFRSEIAQAYAIFHDTLLQYFLHTILVCYKMSFFMCCFVCILIANWTRLIMLKVVRLTSCMYFVNVYINRRLDAANMTQQLFICRKGELSKWRTRNITQAQWGIYTMGNLFVVFEK
jgi:hypothetical protein